MKPTTLLLTASLVANATLVAVLVFRPPTDPAPPAAAVAAGEPARRDSAGHPAASDALRRALESGDAAALQAAGVSPEVARQLLLGRALGRYAEVIRANRSGAAADPRWWRSRASALSGFSREQRQELWAAQRELSDAAFGAFGDDLGLFGRGTADAQYSFLPAGKCDALRRIEQDYAEMMSEFSGGGVQLPSDREKLKLLRAERERDIAALLSPDELVAYEMRSSPTAATIRARYGDAIASEEDFKTIFSLQKAFDEKFPRDAFTGRITMEQMQQRSAAERQFQADLKTALGDEKYAALRRGADSDLRTVDSLAQRLNLPADTGDRVAAAREAYASESQRINADTSLTPQQRRAEIQALGQRAKSEITQTLGGEAAEAYSQRAPWLSMLQGGMAYSTNAADAPPGALTMNTGQSVFPVLPAGATGPGAVRQVVNIAGRAPATATAAPLLFQTTAAAPVEHVSDTTAFTFVRTENVTPAAAPTVSPGASPAPPAPVLTPTLPAKPAPAPTR